MALAFTNRTVDGQATSTPVNSGVTSGGWSGRTGTVGSSQQLPPGFTGQQGEAYTRQTQPNELVSHNLVGLLARDTPYILQQENAGYRRANSRGMLDSSIGVQAGRAAAIESALPIAQGDAAANQGAASQNQQYLNQMALQQQGDATSRYNAELGFNASTYGTDMGLSSQRERLAFDGEQAGLQRTFQDYMARQGFTEDQRNAAMNAGFGLLGASQGFQYNAGLQAMNNPYILQNPEAFGGFMSWMQGDAPAYMNQLFNFAFNLGGYP